MTLGGTSSNRLAAVVKTQLRHKAMGTCSKQSNIIAYGDTLKALAPGVIGLEHFINSIGYLLRKRGFYVYQGEAGIGNHGLALHRTADIGYDTRFCMDRGVR